MRPLEILIAVLLGVCLVWPVSGLPGGAVLQVLPALAALAVLIHLVWEKYRWQMLPLYALSAILFVLGLLEIGARPRAGIGGWYAGALALGLLVLAGGIGLAALLPVPRLPRPSGPHRLGTRTFTLTDEHRQEIYSDKQEPRSFIFQVWYPGLHQPGDRIATWMPGAKNLARAISQWLKLPYFFLDHIALAHGHAYMDAPLDRSAAPYPLLLFSHGWGGFRAQNTYQMQELASHGYVVVGMEHPYGAIASLFPEGRIIKIYHAALPYRQPGPAYDAAARQLAQQWAGDMAFAMDFLTELNSSGPENTFSGALDLDKIGVMGHSTGAGAIVQLCSSDMRCKAGFAEDTYMTPVAEEVRKRGLAQPFFFLFSQVWADDQAGENHRLFQEMLSHGPPTEVALHILGTNHYDFTDLPALSPLAHAMGLKGPIRGPRMHKVVNDYSRAFFDFHLKGKPSSLLQGPSPAYPEVVFDGRGSG